MHQVRNNFHSEFSECFWKLVAQVYFYCQPWQNIMKIHVSMFYASSAIKHEIMLFSNGTSIAFL